MTGDGEQQVLELLHAMPDWAVPIWMRAGERLVKGVPTAEVWGLVREEFAVAQARQQSDVRAAKE